ncbi:hypothetical protein VN97_g7553 [Penicillium thymicola]|uniref:Uncharacterized protein n=1 Tax=Penicillium thymicola TaxID=293382 RepID=A0AAI9X797_PENTH|nr:hypothetical protein VN97_g7553 [Penicillium thymicola]
MVQDAQVPFSAYIAIYAKYDHHKLKWLSGSLRGLVGYDVGLISFNMTFLVTRLTSEGLQFDPGRGHFFLFF